MADAYLQSETEMTHAYIQRRFYPLPDVILFLFTLCIVRQYLWPLGGSFLRNVVAWILSIITASGLVWVLSSKRGLGWEGTGSTVVEGWHSWCVKFDWLWVAIVVAPLLVFFLFRAPLPALDFDTLNYHHTNAERALRGYPIADGDFFPGTLLVNPAPDMAFGVLRVLIGYRLAPILNVLVLFWVANLLNEIFASFIKRNALRYLSILLAITTDHVLYIVNLYMVDLLSIPLLLSALLLTIRFKKANDKPTALIKIALWLGIALAFKLTNVCFVAAIIFLLLSELLTLYNTKQFIPSLKVTALAMFLVALPSLFFLAYMYIQTGNPFFPYYNHIFKSPLMLSVAYKDPAHGPENVIQALLWSIVSPYFPERLSAMNPPLYTGRLTLGFILSCVLALSNLAPSYIRKISVVIIMGSFFWGMISGDIRYALFSEILSGVVCIYVLVYIWKFAESVEFLKQRNKIYIMGVLYASILISIATLSIWFGLIHVESFSEKRFADKVMQPYFMTSLTEPTYVLFKTPFISNPNLTPSQVYFKEASFFLRDQNPQLFFTPEERAIFDKVDVWLNCYDATSGVMTIAAPDKPIVSVAKFLDLFDYMQAEGARQRVREVLDKHKGKRIYTLVLELTFPRVINEVERVQAGLQFGKVERVSIPLYSQYTRTNMLLVEVLR